MSLFASEILHLAPPGSVVDIAITKHARFLDKSGELAQHYPGVQEQVYLTGYDTLVRILDTKYYPVAYTLEPLQAFFESNRIWCMFRTGDEWGGREAQRAYLEAIKRGDREVEGCKKEWGERIEFMDNDLGEPVSSTLVREAAKRQDGEVLGGLLTEKVKNWVLERKLYT
ncbi:hypothetical protein Q9L58_004278 [Maublancomyces gigas]|uniref:Uncharacterized protein n=1 Tax=Discina gigas TaxID=1032678 RepID=A0ABR3GLI7_9PEZI